MNSILRNKLDSRNARLALAVDPAQIIEEAELKVQARELEVTSTQMPMMSYGRIRPCKLVELGYSPATQRRKGTVPKPPGIDELKDIMSPPRDTILGDSEGVSSGASHRKENKRSARSEPVSASPASAANASDYGGVKRNLFVAGEMQATSPPEAGTPPERSSAFKGRSPITAEKDLGMANMKYKEAKLRIMEGNIEDALSLLQEASAACPEKYETAIQKITDLYGKTQKLIMEGMAQREEPVKAADQAYKDAKAALRAGEAENALKLLDWAYNNCPEQYEAARDKISQLRSLAASQFSWSADK